MVFNMPERDPIKVIRLRESIKKQLESLGLYGDTHEMIIERIVKERLHSSGRRDCKDDLC